MDPNETLRTILAALRDGDCDLKAAEYASNLKDYLASGGLTPDAEGRDKRLLMYVFCEAVMKDDYSFQ